MRHSWSFLFIALPSLLSAFAEGATLRNGDDGSLEVDVDLSELRLSRLLQEEVPSNPWGRSINDVAFDSPIGRQYEYEEGSDASLLNELIAVFLPHINDLFKSVVPDPLNIPIRGNINMPQINMFGYCTANAGFNVSLGTMTGLSGLAIDRLQVLTGSERISAGWNIDAGCLETIFTAFFDMEISSTTSFMISDMFGGIRGNICSYQFDELVTGGIESVYPRMRGALSVSGMLTGTKATIKFADIGSSLAIGYDRLEAFFDDAPGAINNAVRNVTAELSILAKDRIVNFIKNDEFVQSITPELNDGIGRSFEGRSVTLQHQEALKLNSAFMRNRMGLQLENAVDNAVSIFQRLGFNWNK